MEQREAIMAVLRQSREFVGLGSLYSQSGLTQDSFFKALRTLSADGLIVDCYGAEGRHAYAYRVAP